MGGGTREEESRSPYLWRGKGNEAATPECGEGFGEHDGGLSAPPRDPPQVQVGSGGPEELRESSDGRQGRIGWEGLAAEGKISSAGARWWAEGVPQPSPL